MSQTHIYICPNCGEEYEEDYPRYCSECGEEMPGSWDSAECPDCREELHWDRDEFEWYCSECDSYPYEVRFVMDDDDDDDY